MGQLSHEKISDNVNVTLESRNPPESPFNGRKFPCCVCASTLEIRVSKKNKPYCTCMNCGIQIFFRGKTGIRRLTEILQSAELAAGNSPETIPAIILFNKITQLRGQKTELEAKQGLIMRDPDLNLLIRAIDNEIKHAQRELEKLARKTAGGNRK